MPTLELSPKLVEKIEQAAKQTGESPEAFLREAVIARLEDLEDIAIATDRLKNPGETISLDELKRDLGLDD
jgi:RHH-type rel operon transcriptional repressor/antitoxin RelB